MGKLLSLRRNAQTCTTQKHTYDDDEGTTLAYMIMTWYSVAKAIYANSRTQVYRSYSREDFLVLPPPCSCIHQTMKGKGIIGKSYTCSPNAHQDAIPVYLGIPESRKLQKKKCTHAASGRSSRTVCECFTYTSSIHTHYTPTLSCLCLGGSVPRQRAAGLDLAQTDLDAAGRGSSSLGLGGGR